MAQDKIRALIIIQGRDNLDNLTEGGVVLDGLISKDIIEMLIWISFNRVSVPGCSIIDDGMGELLGKWEQGLDPYYRF